MAMHWLRLAADKGNSDGQLGVGNLYGQGLGVAQNYGEALRWYRLAAAQGNAEAEDECRRLLYVWHGRGTGLWPGDDLASQGGRSG